MRRSAGRSLCPGTRIRSLWFLLALLISMDPSARPSAQTPDPWHISGERLEGAFGGKSRLDQVTIRHGAFRATASQGTWDPGTEVVTLTGQVRIADSVRVFESDFAEYNRRSRILTMSGHVRGEGPEGKLGGEALLLRRDDGWGRVTGDAWLKDDQSHVWADTLIYDDAASTALALGNVRMLDLADSTRVMGDVGFLDRPRDLMRITCRPPQRPRLTRPSASGQAPLVLEADTLVVERGAREGEARGGVVMQQGDMGASGQRARFFLERDRMELLGRPRAWERNGVIRGDTLRLFLEDGEPRRLIVLGGARTEYLPKDRPGEETFAMGDTLVAHFERRTLKTLEVRGGAQSLYVPGPVDRRAGVGKNWSLAPVLTVAFEDGQAHDVEMTGGAEGLYTFPHRGAVRDSLEAAAPDSLHPRLEERRRLLEEGDLREPDSLDVSGLFSSADAVAYKGERIVFEIPEDRMTLEEGGDVAYQGMSLHSTTIQFNSLRETVVSTGEPVLRDGTTEVVGEKMTYRLDTEKGLVTEGRTDFENGYYRGSMIKKLPGDILYVRDADYTTCDRDTAHFRFHSRAVKIVVKDKASARPVILYLGKIPIFALPYWIFPLHTGRRSGILVPEFEIGFDTSRGRFLRNVGYYFALSDRMDLLTWGDYYEEGPQIIMNARYRYKVRYLLSGDLFGSYSREKSFDGSRSVRWDVRANHEQTLGEDLSLKFRGDFVSDATYRGDRDFGAGADERLNRTLKSNIDLRKRWTWGSLGLTVDRTEFLDENSSSGGGVRIQMLAPSVDFAPTSFTLGRAASAEGRDAGRLPFLSSTYLRTGFSFRNTRTEFFDGPVQRNSAARQTFSLSDNRRLGGVLNLSPSISATAAWFEKDNLGETNRIGAVWSAGASSSTTLYGTFFPGMGPLTGVRHVLEPSVSYQYQPDFPSLQYTDTLGVRRSRFPSVGGIGLGGSKASGVSLGLTQRLHTKWRVGGEEKKVDNLLTWSASTRFDFLRDAWGGLENTLRLTPARFLESRLSLSYDLERRKRVRTGLQTYLRLSGQGLEGGSGGGGQLAEYGEFGEPGLQGNSDPGDPAAPGTTGGPWSLNLTHTLNQGETSESRRSDLNVTASLGLTINWRLTCSLYYDVTDREIKSQGFSLYRDLHCWEARLEKRSSGRSSQYYFRINIKQIPDVKHERRSGL